MSGSPLTRRGFGLAALALLVAPAAAQAPRDQGIGGTGVAPGDRGIGGTGVIGTIRRFGSIYVNDLRIAYAADVEVTIDGARARASDMKIGHVVRTVARGADNALATRRIEIDSEVAGAIDSVSGQSMIVLGQTIDLRGVRERGALKPGARVAVFGQRRPNGIIVASLVEPRAGGRDRIAGPVRADASGRVSIGGMPLRGVPASFAGSRVAMEGSASGGEFVVAAYRSAARPFGREVQRVSIEAYTDARGRTGSGFAVTPAGTLRGGGLSILSGRVGGGGDLLIDAGRPDARGLPDAGGPKPLPLPQAPALDRGGLRGLAPTPGPIGGQGLPALNAPGLPGGIGPGLPGGLGGGLPGGVGTGLPGLGGAPLGGRLP